MRLIDADALSFTHDYVTADGESCITKAVIDNAPTIDAVPHWIPCEERMPEKDGFYLVAIQWDDQSKSVEIFWYSNEFKFGDSKRLYHHRMDAVAEAV